MVRMASVDRLAQSKMNPEKRLAALRARPMMWAFTREAFSALIGCTLEAAGVPRPFQVAISICFGNKSRADVEELCTEVDEEWAVAVVDKAIDILAIRSKERTDNESI